MASTISVRAFYFGESRESAKLKFLAAFIRYQMSFMSFFYEKLVIPYYFCIVQLVVIWTQGFYWESTQLRPEQFHAFTDVSLNF